MGVVAVTVIGSLLVAASSGVSAWLGLFRLHRRSGLLREHPIGEVPNYGHGLALYFIPASLWVGAMLLFFVAGVRTTNAGELVLQHDPLPGDSGSPPRRRTTAFRVNTLHV